jgi:thiamine pyrophosphate-dependent acetolactate synthase large subunit-like protein
LKDRGNALVVAGLGAPTWDITEAGEHPLNFGTWGGMGGAAMIGLGMAIAQAKRRVLVITGDGEQLMGLGALATIGAVAKPPNLGIAVIDNGSYAETGMQRSHTGYGADLCAIARGCGFQKTFEAADLAAVAQLREVFQRGGGPILGVVRVSAHNPPRSLPSRDAVFLKNRFRAHLSLPQA